MKYKKYDKIEIKWLDTHSKGGWCHPEEVKDWVKSSSADFLMTSIGFYISEDKEFLRIAQSYDGREYPYVDGLLAILKSSIKSVKAVK